MCVVRGVVVAEGSLQGGEGDAFPDGAGAKPYVVVDRKVMLEERLARAERGMMRRFVLGEGFAFLLIGHRRKVKARQKESCSGTRR